MNKECVAIRNSGSLIYPKNFPYDPQECYIEFENISISETKNAVYDAIRQSFIDLGMDKANLNTKYWSPLSDLISPGNTVVIKPNMVINTFDVELQEFTTSHPSVIRPIIDYAWKALKGEGKIIVGDAPGAEADFEKIVERNKLKELVQTLQSRGINVYLEDFRAVKVEVENGVWVSEQKNNEQRPTSQIVNIGKNSLFYCDKYKKVKLHGAGYNIKETTSHHKGEVQEYSVSKTILNADVVISVPKFKTHRKAGFTCCLKNLVGINTDKNYLPHFTMGSKNMGGDEMPAIPVKNVVILGAYNWLRENVISRTWKVIGKPSAKFLRALKGNKKDLETCKESGSKQNSSDEDLAKWLHNKLSGQSVAAGAWSGNETICRMILDLNQIFLRCDKSGQVVNKTDRKILYIVDGVKVGVGDGPTHPTPAVANTVAVGYNGLKTDKALLQLCNIDYTSFTLYNMASEIHWMNYESEGEILFNGQRMREDDRISLDVIPPIGWEFKKIKQ